jgi:triacylglycerol esterase/lipase EstA (alpha/beta hydrolase family)
MTCRDRLNPPTIFCAGILVALALAACGSGTTTGAFPGSQNGTASGIALNPGATPTPAPAPRTTPAPVATATATPAAGASASYAPLGQTGPALSVPAAQLAASLSCTPNVATSASTTILLVPGTTLTPSVNFSWNYERAFSANAIPWCAVTLPDNAMADIQTAGEYVVYAIRSVAALSGKKIDILGYSQGGMVPRWALRFWPDTRRLVIAYVGLDPSNHGTIDAYPACAAGCAPALWQQQTGSHFLAALNSGAETFAGIAYTVVYSDTDEVVVPNLPVDSSSSLSGGGGAIANISVQSICPTDVSDHLAMGSYDPVGYALALDAYTHAGLASASRIPLSTCLETLQPGVDAAAFPINYANYLAYVANTLATTPFVSAEPTLAPYVYP